ncbi:hypothetical protein J437_LFUL011012 [Ladona fulva]|uniref:Cuticle protein CPCFC domain-containing protein n=1 Tax=Ladona fulva TaxID=123851 RepID=A0A8K0KJ73_LADFU|nr:hypothetical protein J437_LFUL011012 [Ladona fulva]
MQQSGTLFIMVSKLIVLALCVAGALGGLVPHAAKYPAGVSPHTCPNYPFCDVSAHAVAPYAAHAYAAYGHHAGVPGAAAAYPAGVDPHICPNYPFCGPTPAHHGWAGAGAGAWDDGSYHPWYDNSAHYDDGSYKPWLDNAGHNDDGSYRPWQYGGHHHW